LGDAAAEGRLSNALILENWAFAADLLAGVVSTEVSTLFGQALDARLNRNSSTRSVGDQLLDALTLEAPTSAGGYQNHRNTSWTQPLRGRLKK
jgi:hypothetical protein